MSGTARASEARSARLMAAAHTAKMTAPVKRSREKPAAKVAAKGGGRKAKTIAPAK